MGSKPVSFEQIILTISRGPIAIPNRSIFNPYFVSHIHHLEITKISFSKYLKWSLKLTYEPGNLCHCLLTANDYRNKAAQHNT
jgi:hypothetical protein